MDIHVFSEISALLGIAAGVSLLMRAFKQPLIIGHILTGILVGPTILGLVNNPETIDVLGEFGIALLLFIVGLGLNPKEIKDVGKVALVTGLGQVLFTSGIGFLIVKALGYSTAAAIYISVALTFSSTIIILKLLSDKREQNQLFGKISIGFLLVQDVIAAMALLVASAFGKEGGLSYEDLSLLVVRGVVIFSGIFILASTLIKQMTNFLSKSQELLFLFALAWGFGVAALSLEAGFSLEIGALFAGVSLATMPYAQEVSSRLRPLRDFFIVVFFVALGAGLDIVNIGPMLWQAIGLSLFVLVGNPIIVMILMGIMGYTKRTSFKAGLTVAQISEFSIIFILLGEANGQVTSEIVSLVTIVGIITIAASSYMIIYSDKLYIMFERYLTLFERRKTKSEKVIRHNYDAILFGYMHGGAEYVNAFEHIGKRYIVVDYDPEAIDQLERRKVPYLYGDATDVELLEEAGLEKAKLIVSNITDHETNIGLLKTIERLNPKVVVICHADNITQAEELYALGASYVTMPHYIGNEKISSFIKKSGLSKREFKSYRDQHLDYLHSTYVAPLIQDADNS